MRISDWSSDVCSSDLLDAPARTRHRRFFSVATRSRDSLRLRRFFHRLQALQMLVDGLDISLVVVELFFLLGVERRAFIRSEEHTSELQSLMRISYAVFCLIK